MLIKCSSIIWFSATEPQRLPLPRPVAANSRAPRVAYRFQLTYERRRCLTMFCFLWVCVELEQIRGTNPKPQHQQQHQNQHQQQNYATTTTSKTSARETRVKGVREEHKVRKSTKTIIQIILFITPLRNYILFTLSSVMMRPPSRVEFRRVDSSWDARCVWKWTSGPYPRDLPSFGFALLLLLLASQLRVEQASRHSFDLVADVFINCGNLCAF